MREQVLALRALGYTEREARFLRVAALTGGYFLRRQFNQALGRECGALGEKFVQKILTSKHGSAFRLCGKTAVYHLSSRAIYAALGEPDNRNRRAHEVGTIKRRIMSLDFVLARPECRFLLTAAERMEFLRTAACAAPACCNERHLLFVENSGTRPRMSFVYVDAGDATLSGFETFLSAHREVLCAGVDSAVFFVASDVPKTVMAERMFQRFLSDLTQGSSKFDKENLRQHFADRCRYEAKDFLYFDQAALDRFRREREIFSGAHFDKLYRRWNEEGDTVLNAASKQFNSSSLSFGAHILGHRYDLFGTYQKGEFARCL